MSSVGSSLKEFADSGLQLGDDVLSEVANPLVMALKESKIFILIGLEL